MRSPTTALAWAIWRRGRRAGGWAIACLAFCALVNLAVPGRLRLTETGQVFDPVFGFLMTVSLLLVFGLFNYTEFNSTREWNGFPYRLFSLPLRTWQLVALPMLLGIATVEVVYVAWIKLVLTHNPVLKPEWFAVLLGAYMIFYHTALWSLAGFRIARIIVLSLGGVSSILVAWLPFSDSQGAYPWLSEKYLAAGMAVLAFISFLIAWTVVGRQRRGGGHRRNWIHCLLEQAGDLLPRRNRQFASPAAAQFWFEWRRAGLLLPACVGFALLAIFGPFSWAFRTDPRSTIDTLVKIVAMPIVLAFAIGKGFIKPEFWSTNLSLPQFLGVRPLSAEEFVVSKMKVAALSVTIAWLLVLGFIALWLPLWADKTQLQQFLREFRRFYPHSWLAITILYFAGFAVITWRCLVSGLWVGLSGNRSYYIASACLQVLVPTLLSLAAGLFSDTIDSEIQQHPDVVNSITLTL